MIGAIIGDIVGSIYEIGIYGRLIPVKEEKLKPFKTTQLNILQPSNMFGCFFTDDTVQNLAICSALFKQEEVNQETSQINQKYAYRILNPFDDAEEIKKRVMNSLREYYYKYPKVWPRYGKSYKKWIRAGCGYNNTSIGNGAAMRITPIGWVYNSIEETKTMATLSAQVTHNSPDGIAGAQAVAISIYLARTGYDKDDIKKYLSNQYKYYLNKDISEIRNENHKRITMDITAKTTVQSALIAFLNSNSYDDAIRKAVSLGGDADTIASMTGGIAEAYYECQYHSGNSRRDNRIPANWKMKALSILRRTGCKQDDIEMILNFPRMITSVKRK